MQMINPVLVFQDSYPKIYLDRHFPQRLSYLDMKSLTKQRLAEFLKKHRNVEFKYQHESYTYSASDREYNSYFGTDVESQIKEYFCEVRRVLESKSP